MLNNRQQQQKQDERCTRHASLALVVSLPLLCARPLRSGSFRMSRLSSDSAKNLRTFLSVLRSMTMSALAGAWLIWKSKISWKNGHVCVCVCVCVRVLSLSCPILSCPVTLMYVCLINSTKATDRPSWSAKPTDRPRDFVRHLTERKDSKLSVVCLSL